MELLFISLQSSSSPGMINMIFLALMFGVLYFFFFRPQMRKQKDQTKFMTELEKGSEVVTSSGIIGKITKVEDNIVQLQVDTKTFIRVTKGAISKEMTESLGKES
ncbi:MAG: preprotein translocase subunit YajC [Saprospiraceae bacterium]|nr:preprotein translocase subunit YajC [Saprospiraceae bacterium]